MGEHGPPGQHGSSSPNGRHPLVQHRCIGKQYLQYLSWGPLTLTLILALTLILTLTLTLTLTHKTCTYTATTITEAKPRHKARITQKQHTGAAMQQETLSH
jgi:hypothetical protein